MTDPMTTPPLDLTGLRKTAEAATPGPWEAYDSNEGMDRAYSPMWCVANEEFHNPTTGDDEDWMGVEIHVGDKADSDHIAAFDPPTVLQLLDRADLWEDRAGEAAAKYIDALARAVVAENKVAAVLALLDRWERLHKMLAVMPGASMTPISDVISDLRGTIAALDGTA